MNGVSYHPFILELKKNSLFVNCELIKLNVYFFTRNKFIPRNRVIIFMSIRCTAKDCEQEKRDKFNESHW